jgi:hypothetical protein
VAAPSGIAAAIGVNSRVLAVAATRPSTAAGVPDCTAVTAATRVQGRPTPMTTAAATVPGHQGRQRSTDPAANSSAPVAPTAGSPYRVSSLPVSSPPRMDPAPCADEITPRNAAGLPRSTVTTVYRAAVVKPDMAIVTAAMRIVARMTGCRRRNATPTRIPRPGGVRPAGAVAGWPSMRSRA